MNRYIDTHFHASMFGMDRCDITRLFSDIRSKGFRFGIDIGVHPGDTSSRKDLLENLPYIGIASGLYPSTASDKDQYRNHLDTLVNDIEVHNPVAIGEIGLDWYHGYGTKTDQIQLFQDQIAIANRYALPIIIHTREADEDVVKVIRDHPPEHGGIVHCFSSGKDTARQFLDAGLLISFAGPITYRKNQALQAVVPYIPIDRIVLETDSPYLIPEPFRGKGLKNTPGYMPVIYEKVADLYDTSVDVLCERIETTVHTLLTITESGRSVLIAAD